MKLFYYLVDDERKGPVNAAQLKTLAESGKISKETEIECDGRRVQARNVKGLMFKSETLKAQVEETTEGGEIYGVAEPVAPTPPPFNEDELVSELWEERTANANEPFVASPVAESAPARQEAQPVQYDEAPATKGKFGVNVVLFALSGVFLAFALISAIVGFAQLRKMQIDASDWALLDAEADKVDAEADKIFGVLKPDIERLMELDSERKERLEFLENVKLETENGEVRGTNVELLAYESMANWQKRVLKDAKRRSSSSVETYMDALDHLDFSEYKFVGADAYNCEVNASLFTGLGVLGVGMDVRDVGMDVRDVGDKVQTVGRNVCSASAMIAAGAGFVCAALFASTSALLLALGLLARRTSAV